MSEQNEIKNKEEQKTDAAPAVVPFDPKSFPMKAILGQKLGMTQIFSPSGERIAVSVVSVEGCTLTQVKTKEKDGYGALQIGFGKSKEKNMPNAYTQQFKKRGLEVFRWVREFKVNNPEKFQVGQKVPAEVFTAGDYVDISGTSKGKGYAGVMKRHNFAGLTASHGASDKIRARGSSGGGSGTGQKVWKGTKMAGRLGSEWVTFQKVEIIKVDNARSLLLVKGPLPGAVGNLVEIKETNKSLKHKKPPVAQKSSTKKAAVAAKKPSPKAAAPKK